MLGADLRAEPLVRRRRTYLPTERAIELIPILVELLIWGNANTGAPGRAEAARAERADRDAVIRDLELAAERVPPQ